MVLAQTAVLLGHGQGEEAMFAEDLEVAAGKCQFVIEALGIGT